MSLTADAGFERLQLIYGAALKQRSAWQNLMQKLRHALFPCLDRAGANDDGTEAELNRNQAPIPDAEWNPIDQ